MDWRREVAFGPPRIARLKPSRSVRFTNRFTEPALDVRFSQPSSRRDHVSRPVVHPVTGGPPHESRSGGEPGPADRARRRAVAIPGSPPGRRP